MSCFLSRYSYNFPLFLFFLPLLHSFTYFPCFSRLQGNGCFLSSTTFHLFSSLLQLFPLLHSFSCNFTCFLSLLFSSFFLSPVTSLFFLIFSLVSRFLAFIFVPGDVCLPVYPALSQDRIISFDCLGKAGEQTGGSGRKLALVTRWGRPSTSLFFCSRRHRAIDHSVGIFCRRGASNMNSGERSTRATRSLP